MSATANIGQNSVTELRSIETLQQLEPYLGKVVAFRTQSKIEDPSDLYTRNCFALGLDPTIKFGYIDEKIKVFTTSIWRYEYSGCQLGKLVDKKDIDLKFSEEFFKRNIFSVRLASASEIKEMSIAVNERQAHFDQFDNQATSIFENHLSFLKLNA